MTNEDKAKEIAESCYSKRTKDIPANRVGQLIIKQVCLEMAEWKEHQMIDKAVEWLRDTFLDDNSGMPITKTGVEILLNDFKKAMKGE